MYLGRLEVYRLRLNTSVKLANSKPMLTMFLKSYQLISRRTQNELHKPVDQTKSVKKDGN